MTDDEPFSYINETLDEDRALTRLESPEEKKGDDQLKGNANALSE